MRHYRIPSLEVRPLRKLTGYHFVGNYVLAAKRDDGARRAKKDKPIGAIYPDEITVHDYAEYVERGTERYFSCPHCDKLLTGPERWWSKYDGFALVPRYPKMAGEWDEYLAYREKHDALRAPPQIHIKYIDTPTPALLDIYSILVKDCPYPISAHQVPKAFGLLVSDPRIHRDHIALYVSPGGRAYLRPINIGPKYRDALNGYPISIPEWVEEVAFIKKEHHEQLIKAWRAAR